MNCFYFTNAVVQVVVQAAPGCTGPAGEVRHGGPFQEAHQGDRGPLHPSQERYRQIKSRY